MEMGESCEAEVLGLHRFLEDWLTGALPRTEDGFARFRNVMAEGFAIISPGGVTSGRDELCAELERAHAAAAKPNGGFRIWIEEVHLRHASGDIAVVTYAEYQERSGETTGRRASALFRRKDGTPNGVEWLHLHETWLPNLAPKA